MLICGAVLLLAGSLVLLPDELLADSRVANADPRPEAAAVASEAVPWRRTAEGWEVARWLIPKRVRPAPTVPPTALAGMMLGCAAWLSHRD
ncbi:hypothetical protein JCM19992_08300 [Thermostilla marina]